MSASGMHSTVAALLRLRMPRALIRHELGLLNHTARADIATLDDSGLGLWELKSDADTLKRLPGQVETYSLVGDHCVLVAAPRHLERAVAMLHGWWGVWSYDAGEVSEVRMAEPNPDPHATSIARLMWDAEVTQELRRLKVKSISRLPHRDKCAALAQRVALPELQLMVRARLRERHQCAGGFGLGEVKP